MKLQLHNITSKISEKKSRWHLIKGKAKAKDKIFV
jgi:hypothetical protein